MFGGLGCWSAVSVSQLAASTSGHGDHPSLLETSQALELPSGEGKMSTQSSDQRDRRQSGERKISCWPPNAQKAKEQQKETFSSPLCC